MFISRTTLQKDSSMRLHFLFALQIQAHQGELQRTTHHTINPRCLITHYRPLKARIDLWAAILITPHHLFKRPLLRQLRTNAENTSMHNTLGSTSVHIKRAQDSKVENEGVVPRLAGLTSAHREIIITEAKIQVFCKESIRVNNSLRRMFIGTRAWSASVAL